MDDLWKNSQTLELLSSWKVSIETRTLFSVVVIVFFCSLQGVVTCLYLTLASSSDTLTLLYYIHKLPLWSSSCLPAPCLSHMPSPSLLLLSLPNTSVVSTDTLHLQQQCDLVWKSHASWLTCLIWRSPFLHSHLFIFWLLTCLFCFVFFVSFVLFWFFFVQNLGHFDPDKDKFLLILKCIDQFGFWTMIVSFRFLPEEQSQSVPHISRATKNQDVSSLSLTVWLEMDLFVKKFWVRWLFATCQ